MTEFISTTEVRFIIAIFLGLLVGLEREASMADRNLRMFGGVRTFALIAMYGFACGWLAKQQYSWAIPVGMISITSLALIAYFTKTKLTHYGTTSEVSAFLTFIVGVLAMVADVWLAAAIGVINAFLLSEKAQLEGMVEKLNRTEFLAIVKFLIVTVIILPVLPDRSFTQFELNPHQIWRIVVMVSTIGFVGYFLTKRFGDKIGLWLSGILGGIVSSTAVSVAMGRTAQKQIEISSGALRATILACSVMYLRILAFIWFINPILGYEIWWKLIGLSLIGVVISFTIRTKNHFTTDPESRKEYLQNPFEIKPAAIFAMLFVLLTVITEYTKSQFGHQGLFILSGIVGATDIDPYILSLAKTNFAFMQNLVTAIVIASMSNTLFKGMYFSFFARKMFTPAMIRFGIWAVLHIPFCF